MLDLIDFDQVDEDHYMLTLQDEHSTIRVSFNTSDTIDLFEAVEAEIGDHIREMRSVKAALRRGYGPNGELRGTWEDAKTDWADEQRYAADLARKAGRENA